MVGLEPHIIVVPEETKLLYQGRPRARVLLALFHGEGIQAIGGQVDTKQVQRYGYVARVPCADGRAARKLGAQENIVLDHAARNVVPICWRWGVGVECVAGFD